MSVKECFLYERPRERCLKHGTAALSTPELIALILGSGTQERPVLALAHEICKRFKKLEDLFEASIEELCLIKGVGRAQALKLQAAFALAQRALQSRRLREKVLSPEQVYRYIKWMFEGQGQESFVAIPQDVKGYALRAVVVSVGTLSQTLVHPREVFHVAIRHRAAGLVVAHNHPSGDPTPSQQDIVLTTRLIESGKILGIPLKDHLIIGKDRYISLRQIGLKFD